MEITEQEKTSVVLISGYGDGGFRLGDKRREGHILVFGAHHYPWTVKSKKSITKQSLKALFSKDQKPEFLILGLGEEVADPVILSRKLEKTLGLPVEVMTTGAAARTYNVLTLEGRLVAAALLAI